MNKYSTITIIAIVAMVLPIVYGFWNMYSVEQLQLRTPNNKFSYFDMSNSEKIKICNPTPFFVSFNGIEIDVYYQDDVKGTFKVDSATLDPNTFKILDVNFTSESFSESQYMFMHMDGEFSGSIDIRLDPNKMLVNTIYQTNIIGIIPYEQTITQSAFDFSTTMNENSSCDDID